MIIIEEEKESYPKSWSKTISGDKFNSDGTPDMDNISDGYHTFGELYEHRVILLALLCKMSKNYPGFHASKSKLHSDGTMFPGMFIVNIDMGECGTTSYHISDKYWDLYDIEELDKAPEYDNTTPEKGLDNMKKFISK